MSPRVKPKGSTSTRSSYAEFRSQQNGWSYKGVDPVYADAGSVFWKLMTAPSPLPGSTNEFSPPSYFLADHEQRVLSKATSGAGGYLVPTDFEDQILQVAHTRSTIGQLARTVTTPDGATMNIGTSSAHGTATWTAENAAYTVSDETFGQVSVGAFKATTAVIVSEELAQDATDSFDTFLATELGARIAQLEGASFATGSGTGQPQGVSANTGTTVTMATGNTTTYAYSSLVDTVHSVAAGYRTPDQNPAWVISDGGLKALRKLTEATTNAPLLQDLGQDQPRLLGYPVFVDDNLATPSANAVSAIFAAWQPFYTIRRVSGISVSRQDEIYSANGQIGYRATHRVDGRVAIAAAGVAVKHSAS